MHGKVLVDVLLFVRMFCFVCFFSFICLFFPERKGYVKLTFRERMMTMFPRTVTFISESF